MAEKSNNGAWFLGKSTEIATKGVVRELLNTKRRAPLLPPYNWGTGKSLLVLKASICSVALHLVLISLLFPPFIVPYTLKSSKGYDEHEV